MKPATEVREATEEQTLALRTEVLRPGSIPDARLFGVEDAEETRHFAAFAGEAMAGACYIVRRAAPFDASAQSWQLRGMAVETDLQGQGIGTQLVARVEDEARRAGIEILWFNARRIALGFYARLGFEPWGEEFEIPVVGPHTVMWKRLDLS